MAAVHTFGGNAVSMYSCGPYIRATMRVTIGTFLLLTITCLLWEAQACEPNQTQNGCKIYGSACMCGFGCKTEYIYRTRRACQSALRERSSNICFRQPCVRGICIQTVMEPGYVCKCEGTGYYGLRCEKACPTVPVRGLVFPHECVVI